MKFSGILRRVGVLPIAVALLLVGCGTPRATSSDAELSLADAAILVADGLAKQLDQRAGVLSSLSSSVTTRVLVVDPMIDPASGLHTKVSKDFERLVVQQLQSKRRDIQVLPFTLDGLQSAQLLLIGTIGVDPGGRGAGASTGRAQVAILAPRSGQVLAQASTRLRDATLDATPGTFEQDSPAVMLDDGLVGYVQTAQVAPGGKAAPEYLRQLNAATSIEQGTDAYNRAKYGDALRQFQSALADPSGEQMRALNGNYLASVKLGRADLSEQAFARIVAYGIAHRSFSVKILFNPGSTDFWSDPVVSGQYDMWLRQTARGLASSNVCMLVVGHASHSGSETGNDRLSEMRAQRIRQRLIADNPRLGTRITAKGVGWRENIIGSGTDDARDAIDRRVGFTLQECKGSV